MSEELTIDDRILLAVRRISRAIALHSRALLHRHGLTAPQLVTLRELVRLQPVPVGELAGAVHLSQATMTGILDRLERRNLIDRARDIQDRRTVRVRLSEQGQELMKNSPSLLHDQFRGELARLAHDEQAIILTALERVAAMMGADKLPAATLPADPLADSVTNGTAHIQPPAPEEDLAP